MMNKPYLFEHEAMKTTYTLRLLHPSQTHAKAAALDAIALLDEIEGKLSRYIEGSDVWQINHMETGEQRFISELTYDCLCAGLEAYKYTHGRFDITLGRLIEQRKNQNSALPELSGNLMIDPGRPAIYCIEAGREIDLGGIGKGYALECMKSRLLDWEIQSALLSAGSSTQLAYGETAWTIQLQGDESALDIELKNRALSSSGTGIQGAHIVAPEQSISDEVSYARKRTWLLHESATMADVWSTALLLIHDQELAQMENLPSMIYHETEKGIIPL